MSRKQGDNAMEHFGEMLIAFTAANEYFVIESIIETYVLSSHIYLL